MTGPTLSETDLLHVFIERAPFALPGIHVERRNIINARTDKGYRVRNGIRGQSDAFAVYRGQHVEIETKAARGALEEAQERWRARCVAPPQGGPPLCPHLVLKARPQETPDDTVNRWIEELRIALHA